MLRLCVVETMLLGVCPKLCNKCNLACSVSKVKKLPPRVSCHHLAGSV